MCDSGIYSVYQREMSVLRSLENLQSSATPIQTLKKNASSQKMLSLTERQPLEKWLLSWSVLIVS